MTVGIYPRPSAEERFWSKVDKSGKCWEWVAGIQSGGYGIFWHNGETVVAHRFAYEITVGKIPEGLTLDHLCRVRHCVNPKHLEPVTSKENVLRGIGVSAQNARKTHCKRGHPLSGKNLLVEQGGGRQCRECKRERSREWKKKVGYKQERSKSP